MSCNQKTNTMKAQITHRTRTQNHSLIIVSAFALSMTALLVTDMVRNSITQYVSATSAIESHVPAHLTSLPFSSTVLPSVDVVAPKLPVNVTTEQLPIENWMLDTETWLTNEAEEPVLMLQDWMFDYTSPSQVVEEAPALESWMYSLDGWISGSMAEESVEIQSWMYDASNWL